MNGHTAQHDVNNSPSLMEENERLRLELIELRRRISKMENLQKQQQQEHRILVPSLPSLSDNHKKGSKTLPRAVLPDQNKKTKPDDNSLVLELPLVLSNNGKAKDSVSTTDERETEEPPMDIEAHQSSSGLHHRVSPRNTTHKASTMITLSTISTQKSRLSDGENSSTTSRDDFDDEDPLGESRGLIVGELRNRRSQTHEKDANVWVRPTRAATTDNNNNESHHQMPFCQSLTDRAGWLIGLLVFQSLSSFILAKNQVLLQHHPVIVQFLTMLVGAGGNAGNQASVGVVRGIAVGTIHRSNARKYLTREFAMGVALSLILGLAGFVRAKVFAVPWMETFAITSSLFMIVIISVVVGATLPLAMQAVGIDPAHSSTTIQVIMDISGVVITVHVSAFMLDSDFNEWLTDKFD